MAEKSENKDDVLTMPGKKEQAKKAAKELMREAGDDSKDSSKKGGFSAYIKDHPLLTDLITFAVAAVIIVILRVTSVIMPTEVTSGSMNDTLAKGDHVFASCLPYVFGDVERGDVIFFKYPDDESETFVKRVIGLPGETVTIVDGLVYINGSDTPLDEPYLKETPIGSYGPYTVPEGSYFVLGDNRNNSKDSRKWRNTFVSEDQIYAKGLLRWFPFKKFGTVKSAKYGE